MSLENGSKLYQRLEDEEAHAHHYSDGDDDGSSDDKEDHRSEDVGSKSFVDELRSRGSTILRQSSNRYKDTQQHQEDGSVPHIPEHIIGTGSVTTSRSPNTSILSEEAIPLSRTNSITSSPQHQLSTSRSHSSELDSDLDWEDEDDAVRRYHFEYRQEVPLPVEFTRTSLPKRLWQSFMELRTAARQRRAARLLTMPSETCWNKTHVCVVTWLCDATDRGMMLVASMLALWIIVGMMTHASGVWWWTGVVLFVVRVSARRVLEHFHANKRLRRQRLSTRDAMELPATSSSSSTSFRRQDLVPHAGGNRGNSSASSWRKDGDIEENEIEIV